MKTLVNYSKIPPWSIHLLMAEEALIWSLTDLRFYSLRFSGLDRKTVTAINRKTVLQIAVLQFYCLSVHAGTAVL